MLVFNRGFVFTVFALTRVYCSARQNQYMLVATLSHHYFFCWLNKPLDSSDKCKEINKLCYVTAGLCHYSLFTGILVNSFIFNVDRLI